MSNTRSPWDTPDDPSSVVEDRGPVGAGDGDDRRRREPSLERDGYTVLARRPHCARPGEVMSNERAARREKFDEEYGDARSQWPYETED